jgi:hypothetical protein
VVDDNLMVIRPFIESEDPAQRRHLWYADTIPIEYKATEPYPRCVDDAPSMLMTMGIYERDGLEPVFIVTTTPLDELLCFPYIRPKE